MNCITRQQNQYRNISFNNSKILSVINLFSQHVDEGKIVKKLNLFVVIIT